MGDTTQAAMGATASGGARGERACPLCAGAARERIARIDLAESDFAAEPMIEVASCLVCGMGFTSAAAAQADVDARYEARSKYALHVPKPKGAPEQSAFSARAEPEWDLARLRETAALLSGCCDPDAPTLDVGCATGALLAALEAAGFRALFGLEPSPEAVRTAAATTRATVYAGSAFAPPVGLPAMHLVTLCHVLEHVADVHAVLGAIARLTADEGLLYVEVPDATEYARHVVAPYQDFNTEHINHFSPELLERAVVSHGFARVRLERKTIRCSPIDPYPAVFGLFRKRAGGHAPPPPAARDEPLVRALRRYAQRSAARLQEVDAQLCARLRAGDSVSVWGAGELLLKLLPGTVLGRCSVRAIVDASPSKQGLRIHGIRVTAPATLTRSDVPIVVASLVHRDAIVAALRGRLGEAQPIIALV